MEVLLAKRPGEVRPRRAQRPDEPSRWCNHGVRRSRHTALPADRPRERWNDPSGATGSAHPPTERFALDRAPPSPLIDAARACLAGCRSSPVPLLRTSCTGLAGWAAERTGSPAEGGGPHPQGRNEVEDLSVAQVAARRGGTKGKRRPSCRTASRPRKRQAPPM